MSMRISLIFLVVATGASTLVVIQSERMPVNGASASSKGNYHRPELVLPETGGISWKPALIEDLTCPPIHPRPSGDFVELEWSVDFYSEHNTLAEYADGILCHKLRYEIKCSENFFFAKTESKTIRPVDISEVECRNAVQELQVGSSMTPYFPARSCIWMKVNSVHLDFVLTEDKAVGENLYGPEFVDPIFPQGRCRTEVCQTLNGNTIWVGRKSPSDACPTPKQTTASWFLDSAKCKYVRIPGYPLSTCEMVCKLNFCNQLVYLLDSGLGIIRTDGEPELPFSVPSCGPERRVAMPTKEMILDTEILDVQELNRREQCILELISANSRKTVSRALLSSLNPVWPGIHPVYRINNGSLEMSRTLYTKATTSEVESLRKHLCSGRISSLDWTVNRGGGSDGPNGMWKNGTRVIFPKIEMLVEEYADIITVQHDLSLYKHPSVRILGNQTRHFSVTLEEKEERGSLINQFENFFHSFLGSLTIGVISIVLALLFLNVAIKCLIRNMRGKREKAKEGHAWNHSNRPVQIRKSARPGRITV